MSAARMRALENKARSGSNTRVQHATSSRSSAAVTRTLVQTRCNAHDQRQQRTQELDLPSSCSRRDVLLSINFTASALMLAAPGSAWADEASSFFQRGMARYIKKKRLDPLDTYVPLVLQAREQLVQAGKVMIETPEAARELLRTGPFDGMRQNVRVLGEYAVINKKEKESGPLVNGFFRALEAYDQALTIPLREQRPVDFPDAQVKLDVAVQALDALLNTVPEDVMERSKRVLEVTRAKERAAAELEAQESSGTAATEPANDGNGSGSSVQPEAQPADAQAAPAAAEAVEPAAPTASEGPESAQAVDELQADTQSLQAASEAAPAGAAEGADAEVAAPSSQAAPSTAADEAAGVPANGLDSSPASAAPAPSSSDAAPPAPEPPRAAPVLPVIGPSEV